MRLFDTHAHYDDKSFDNDRDALLASIRRARQDLSLLRPEQWRGL